MQRILTLAFALALIAGAAEANKPCRGVNGQKCPPTALCARGKLCGNTCIPKSAMCPQGVKLPPKVGPAYRNANAPPYGGNGPGSGGGH
ncbi:MAG TPA: hypothetical protein VN814_06460 [Caulobacteraceae bacterium]|nr:hypothetical protein [Caulobacteraceae bacterium]